MATTLSTLYPPLIETFMPAFPYTGPAVITFSISSYNETNSFKKIHIALSKQKTNNSVLQNTTENFVVLNNIWILNVTDSTYVSTKDGINYTVRIPSDILNTDIKRFIIDDYYKVQIRLDNSVEIPSDVRYLSSQRPYFSEWSSVCLIKAIPKVSLEMSDFKAVNVLENQNINQQVIRTVQKGIVPIVGRLKYENLNNDSNNTDEQTTTYDETLQKYRITITSKKTNEIADQTGWVLTASNQNPNQIYWLADLTNAEAEEVYIVKIEYYTKNQYYDSQIYYLQIESYDATPFEPIFEFAHVTLDNNSSSIGTEEKITTEEDGFVTLTITTATALPPGYIYIKRATSLDNFKKWELLSCTKNTGLIERTVVDKTVGSLVRYRYSVQYYFSGKNLWSETKFSTVYDLKSGFYDVYPNFHDILLLRGDKQLAIRYNTQITNYSTVINRQVINTLGSKYPKFAENAQMNYKKISISGLLTAESDFNRTFLNDRDYARDMNAYDKEMDGVYFVRNDTLADGVQTYRNISPQSSPNTYNIVHNLAETTNHDLYPKDNWWWERKFRDVALEWLNDGEPKLFRSMTEGNMAVMISDVSLSPNAQLGRRIYNISMTAYEIGDGYSLDTLSALGIIDVPNAYEDDLAAKGMGINDSDEDDSYDDGSISITTVGQLYKRSGKTLEGKKILSCVLDDNNLLMTNNNTELFTINDFYKFIKYQGEWENYKPEENSYVLTDVRIQFNSRPTWFELNNSDKDKIQPADSLIEIANDETEDLNKSINKKSKYNTIIGGYNTQSSKNTSISNNTNNAPAEKHYGLGYKLGICFKDPSLNSDSLFKEETIFVGEKGYYQIPSNIEVKEIKLYENAEATIDYKLSYKIKYDENTIPKEASIEKPFVGQISGRWEAETDVYPLISKKYEYVKMVKGADGQIDYDKGKKGIEEVHSLDKLSAFGFDGTTYTVLRVKFKGQNNYEFFTVGRTGVYNLMPEYPIDEIMVMGRRLFRKENPDYSHERYNITYKMDSSTYMYQRRTENILQWESLDDLNTAPVLIIYNDAIDNNLEFGIIENKVRKLNNTQTGIALIIGDLEDEDTLPYSSIKEVVDPEFNTIYGFFNEDQEIVLKLYNNNGIWEDIELGLDESSDTYILNVKGDTAAIKTKKKKFGLYDWEYDLDKSADPAYREEMLTWYNVLTGDTGIPVVAKVTSSDEIPVSHHIFKIGEEETIPLLDGYNSIEDIKEPQYNVVYGVKINNEKTDKLYYIDGHWYDIAKYKNNENDDLTILAKVPIDGMINYRGRIISLIYDNSLTIVEND